MSKSSSNTPIYNPYLYNPYGSNNRMSDYIMAVSSYKIREEQQQKNIIGYKDRFENPQYDEERGFVLSATIGNLENCKLYLSRGGDINANNSHGTALGGAAKNNHVEVCRFLIKHGAYIDLPDINGQTPLMLAAEFGEVGMCELLLAHGAHISAKGNGVSLEHCVEHACKNKLEIYNLFVEHGLYPNVNQKAITLSEISTGTSLSNPIIITESEIVTESDTTAVPKTNETSVSVEDPVQQLGAINDASDSIWSWCTIL